MFGLRTKGIDTDLYPVVPSRDRIPEIGCEARRSNRIRDHWFAITARQDDYLNSAAGIFSNCVHEIRKRDRLLQPHLIRSS